MTGKRTIERRLDRIDEGRDYPEVSLAQLIAADELEEVDPERNIVRVDGQLMKDTVSPILRDRLNDE
ncbi:hypothetical protein GRS80_10295 [Natrialba sp. INN-245]|nr:hypothetical protein [Natrialba sp. INN-245]